jgi:hypothetical protein
MPFILILGLFVPRIVIAVLYLFTNWFSGVFNTWIWPLLGFIFMPYTLLWYSVVMNWFGGVWGVLQIIVMVLAILLDLSSNKRAAW